MAADLMEERHDCGADAPQGAEYTPDGTLCVRQAKCARSAFGGTRTSANISILPHIIEACPSTTTKLIPPALHVDISQRISALDALTSKLLLVQENHAVRPIADKRAGGCATPPVSDISISPDVSEQVPDDEAEYYTPLEPSDYNPTQKIEHTYQIPCSPSESPDYRLPTKAPKFTNAPERGAVNATKPSNATAHKGASDDRTKKCSMCQRTSFLPSRIIYRVPQQDIKSYIATRTKECPAQSSDAQGFPDTCAPTSTAGQGAGNDGAESRPGELAAPCAAPVAELATDDDVRYERPTGDQDTEHDDIKASYPTKFGHADTVEISARNGFLDGGAPNERSSAGSPAFSETTTLLDPLDISICKGGNDRDFDSPTSLNASSIYHTPESPVSGFSFEGPTAPAIPSGQSSHTSSSSQDENGPPPSHTSSVGQVSSRSAAVTDPIGHRIPEELFRTIVSHVYDVIFWGGNTLSPKERFRALGFCALASRFWARELRYILLERLFLRSEQDVRRMVAVMATPKDFPLDHPACLIKEITIVSGYQQPIWVYSALRLFPKYPPMETQATAILQLGAAPSELQPATASARLELPRYPPDTFRNVSMLLLNSVQFKWASECFKLLRECHNLEYLRVRDLRWDPASPHTQLPAMPPKLRSIVVHEAHMYSHGGRGVMPWMLASITATSCPHILAGPAEGSSKSTPITIHPLQTFHLMDILYVFYDPQVSSILESEDEIMWRLGTGCQCHARAGGRYVEVIGRCPGTPIGPVVTPHITFTLQSRASPATPGVNHLFATKIELNCRSLKPTTEELQMYDWAKFFGALVHFEHLDSVKLEFATPEQCETMAIEHRGHIEGASQASQLVGRKLCQFTYLSPK